MSSGGGRWKFLKGKLGLKSITCCSGGIWGLGAASSNMRVREEEEEDDLEMQLSEHIADAAGPTNNNTTNGRDCVPRSTSGINLAMALAAERHYRAAQEFEVGPSSSSSSTSRSTSNNATVTGTPMRVSLLRLLEEGDGVDFDDDDDFDEEDEDDESGKEKKGSLGSDVMCCVCMRRKKGAAFIPCGHTFCRVCSRELWLNRGSCPLCNRSILEILDIF